MRTAAPGAGASSAPAEAWEAQIIDQIEYLFPDLATGIIPPGSVAGQPFESLSREEQEDLSSVRVLAGIGAGQIPIDARDFSWVTERTLRGVLVRDYEEAQRAYAAGAYKGAALLAAGLIEGMVLEVVSRLNTEASPRYDDATKGLPRARDGVVDWGRAGLVPMMDSVVKLDLAPASTLKWVQGTQDVRDTVHPRAEVRQRARAQREEATLLLTLGRLLYRHFGSLDEATAEGAT